MNKIDWLSFTFPILPRPEDEWMSESISEAFYATFEGMELPKMLDSGWQVSDYRRAPYTLAWRRKEEGLSIFAHPNLNHATFEASGKGCDWLADNDMLLPVIRQINQRITRIDIATDIETPITAEEFANERENGRIKTFGSFKSPSGETVYIGSQKSEMYARVYRYAPPHPRAPYLRIEHVLRRKYARALADSLLENGIDVVQSQVGARFAWKHRIWQPSSVGEKRLQIPRADRNSGRTLRWLLTSCVPAFQRLVQDGIIEQPEAWLIENFLS